MADLALLALALAWGTTFLLVKNALAGTAPGVFLALRFGLAVCIVGFVALVRRDRPTPGLLRHGLMIGGAMFGGFAFQTLGLKYTTPARSAFITGLCVLIIPFLSQGLYKRAVGGFAWVGVLLAVAGLAMLYGDAISASMQLGDVLTAVCALCYAFQIVWTGEYSARHPLALLTLLELGTTCAGSLLLLPLEPVRLASTPALWGTVLFTGAVMTAGAFFLVNWAQRRTSAVRAALIFSLEPVAAALFSAAFGPEVLTRSMVLGGALILAGVLFGEVGGAMLSRSRAAR